MSPENHGERHGKRLGRQGFVTGTAFLAVGVSGCVADNGGEDRSDGSDGDNEGEEDGGGTDSSSDSGSDEDTTASDGSADSKSDEADFGVYVSADVDRLVATKEEIERCAPQDGQHERRSLVATKEEVEPGSV